MFNDWVYRAIEAQRQRELIERAERYRMIRESRQAGGNAPGIALRLINRLGSMLIRWGERLQTSATPAWRNNDCPEFER